ncbi:MAG: PEP-CTERM sorting domain-containing protein [Gemmatimonadaceae bacterium]
MKNRIISVIAAATLAILPSVTQAQLVGTGTGANNFPFGGSGTVYQQVYASSNFPSGGNLQSVSFFLDPEAGAGSFLRTGTYSLFVSTTSVAVNALSTSNFDSNRGANNILFGTYVIGANTASPNVLTFAAQNAFNYVPGAGNLLLDFRISGGGASTSAFYKADNGDAGGAFSRSHDFGSQFADWGLQTQFNYGPTTTTPEPSTIVLMGAGFLAVFAARRRRTN